MYNNPSAGAGIASGGSGVLAYTGGASTALMIGVALGVLALGCVLAYFGRRLRR